MLRIPSINPPDPPGPELVAAERIAAELRSFGLVPEVLEPFPGRGSVVARLRGDGTGGDPLLILSHLDVVAAAPEGWTHGPFDGDVADGYVYGRGAVDMKAMVALSVGVMRLLAARARDAGLDPATDPIPGLRRDILFASTADEENGGWEGAGWIVDNRPELLRAAAAFSEAGGVSADAGGAASTRSRSRRRATRSTGSTSRGRRGTGRCPATTTPRSSRPRSSAASRRRASRGSRRSCGGCSTR